jgi:DNA (cytosine-5)-methyltransferase 1
MYKYYDFFSGAGMVRIGLGPEWQCIFANDIDPKKTSIYRLNFNPGSEYVEGDLGDIAHEEVPDGGDLAWSSFPCQDLSLAGKGKGLNGNRSSAYWYFWNIIKDKANKGFPTPIIVIENVVGLVTSNKGSDYSTILRLLYEGGYSAGAIVVDASLFLPQSRPRIFIIAINDNLKIPKSLLQNSPTPDVLFPRRLIEVVYKNDQNLLDKWIWWKLPIPRSRNISLQDIIEWDNTDIDWHTSEQTDYLFQLMNSNHRKRVEERRKLKFPSIGTIYRRTRIDSNGSKVQRAEVRFDGISGALRTPIGGSSRQIIILIRDGVIRTRLISSREAARLMGLPDSYRLPNVYNDAYHLIGDGVVVDVVSWLSTHLFKPLLDYNHTDRGVA